MANECSCQQCFIKEQDIQKLRKQNNELQLLSKNLEKENTILKNEITLQSRHIYNYDNLSKDKKMFKVVTGMEPDDFIPLYDFVNPGKDGNNIKYYESNKGTKYKNYQQSEKPVPKPKIDAKDQLFLYLTWL